MLDIGTKVKIKSWEEIRKTLDEDDKCNGLFFNPKMQKYCGAICNILSQSSNNYRLENTQGFYWIPEWFDVVAKPKYLNDGSVEQRSLCLALIRQTISGNEPDLNLLITYHTFLYPNAVHGGFSYGDFPDDRWDHTGKIASNIPDWPCIKLKPEILEEAIKNCLSQHNLGHFKEIVIYNINSWFIFCNTEKDDFWYDVAKALSHSSNISTETNTEQSIKT